MPNMNIELTTEELSSLSDASHGMGLEPREFAKRAILSAVVSANPEVQGPIRAIRSAGGYAEAMGPFEIIEAPLENKLARPVQLTRKELMALADKGVAKVAIRFTLNGASREPDFTIKELLK